MLACRGPWQGLISLEWTIGEVEAGRADGQEGVRVQGENVLKCNVRHVAQGMNCFGKCTLLHLDMQVHGM